MSSGLHQLHRDPSPFPRNSEWPMGRIALLLTLAFCIVGCSKPDAANIALRKEKQELVAQLAEARSQRDANAATIRSLQADRPTTQSLPQDRIEKLVTTNSIRVGNLTSLRATDTSSPTTRPIAPYLLEVHAAPLDETADSIKAAGSFSISAFDLSKQTDNLLGHWEFAVDQTRPLWLSGFVVYEYAMPCPLNALPAGKDLTVRVTFTDELTGRTFESQKIISAEDARGRADEFTRVERCKS